MRLGMTFDNHRDAATAMRSSTTPEAPRSATLDALRLETQQSRIRALERAYEAERTHRDELEQKYARLKRRYIRLERAHATLLATGERSATGSDASPPYSTASSRSSPPTQHTQTTDHDDSTRGLIDLTSPTHSRGTSLASPAYRAAAMQNSEQRAFASDDFCAQSPTSPEDSASIQPIPTPSLRTTRSTQSSARPSTAPPAPSTSTGTSRRRHLEFDAPDPLYRPRPRLGPTAADVSVSIAFNQRPSPTRTEIPRERDGFRSRRSPSSIATEEASAAPQPATLAVDADDSSESASLALAQYLQQQENEAAMREYEQHLLASTRYESSSAAATEPSMALQDSHVDPDNMTYEELLQLGERVGDVKKERWREISVQVLSSLPTHRWSSRSEEDVSCIICQCCFNAGEVALTLPCAHVFHEDCVTGWVRENNCCPLCKLAIADM